MTYKELFYFTGHCLALDEHPSFREQVIKMIHAKNGDLENFIQLCSDHLIIPAIYLKFKAHDILKYLPEDFIQALKEIYDLNHQRNEQILRQIDDLTATLNKENIQPVFLKGTANLLDGVYSDLGERMIGDIDFLVKEEDYLKTAEILKGIGYQNDPYALLDNRERMHYPVLTKVGEVAPVEIHRLPVLKKYTSSFNSGMIFREKKEVTKKPGLYVTSDRNKLIHSFIHGQLVDKGHAYKQTSFRDLNDLYRLSKRRNVSYLASDTSNWKQAIDWLVFSQRVLGLPGKFYSTESWAAKWYCLKYNCSLLFFRTHYVYVAFKKIFDLVIHGYISGVLKAIVDIDERQYLFRRITNPQWYRAHWKHYKEYIS